MTLLESLLLGNSQTFIGVLATLVVLCVIANSSNFIKEIHLKIKEEVDSTLETISDDISSLDIDSTPEHRKMDEWMNVAQKTGNNTDLVKRADELIFGQSTRKFTVNARKLYDTLTFSKKFVDVVNSSNITVLSPLYCLFLTLLVFLCDEFVSTFSGSLRYAAVLCNIVSLISIFMWAVLWSAFQGKVSSLLHNFDKGISNTGFEFRGGRNKFSFKLAGYIILYVAILFYLSIEGGYHTDFGGMSVSYKIFSLLSTILTVGLPIFIVMSLPSHPIEVKSTKYTYFFPFFHFLFILGVATVCTAIFFALEFLHDGVNSVNYLLSDRTMMVWLVIAFVMTFGLIIPAVVPAMALIRIKGTSERKRESLVRDARKSYGEFLDQIRTFNAECDKVS